MIKGFTIKVFESLDEDIKHEWNQIITRNTFSFSIFQTFDWQKNWIEQILKNNDKLFIILVKKNDKSKSACILPMYLKKKRFFNILEFTGFPFSDFNLPICDSGYTENDFKNIFKLVLKENLLNDKIDIVHLFNQPESLNSKRNALYDCDFFLKLHDKISYKININNLGNIDNILDQKKLKFLKQDFRRIEKKFHKVQYSFCKTEKEKREVIDFVIKKKSEQYIREGSWNFLELENYQKFIKLFINNKDLQLNYLKINDNLVSAHYGFLMEKTFYYIFPVYDYKFKNLSSGNLLLYRLINDHLSKSNYFDFTVGAEKYKEKWCNYKVKMSDNLFINGFIGWIYYLFQKSKKHLSKNDYLKKKLRLIYLKINKNEI
tara:strand:- start:858 stop:1982 length:1125 start_codon:yes stop_codon:yes gene_type:complete